MLVECLRCFQSRYCDVTSAFSAINVAGPLSTSYRERWLPVDLSAEEFPYLPTEPLLPASMRDARRFVGELGSRILYPRL